MIKEFNELIASRFNVNEKSVAGYAIVKAKGMKFFIHSYEVEGLGAYSTLSMSAMLGLMKMETVIFTPLYVDAPLLSYDRIFAMKNDTLIVELYDTVAESYDLAPLLEIKKQSDIYKDHDLGSHWYDYLKMSPSISKREKVGKNKFDEYFLSFASTYLDTLNSGKECNPAVKRLKTSEYVDGLFANGGPSTDQFVKMLGKDKAYDLFSKYIFSSQK